MEKKRQSDRKALKVYLQVNDGKTGELVGHAVDITEKGIMLTSEGPIKTETGFELKLELPAEIEGAKEISFSAQSQWSVKDSEIIAEIIQKYCF